MSRGIQVTNGKSIGSSQPEDFVVDTKLQGGMKVHKVFTVINDRDPNHREKTSDFAQVYNWIYSEPHDLGYVPAYIAYKGYGTPNNPKFLAMPLDNASAVGGNADFVNVDETNVIVGFDANYDPDTGNDNPPFVDFMRIIVFAERLDAL